jgi:hypothetical protein
MRALIAQAVEQFGRIDCLFNNAGGPSQTGGIEALDVGRFDFQGKARMSAALRLTEAESRPFYLAVTTGLACAFVIGKALPVTINAISSAIEPLCAISEPAGSTRDTIEPITKGEIRSQLAGGPVEIFKVGQSFFEPPEVTHLVSANASNTEPAELNAVFVADEGAQLTTLLE